MKQHTLFFSKWSTQQPFIQRLQELYKIKVTNQQPFNGGNLITFIH